MPLVIEDGSIVVAADSYVSEAGARAYATKRGESLPVDDAACAILLTKALDYIEALEYRFKGERVDETQPLSWPRTGVTINGRVIAATTIPQQLIALQCQLAIDAQTVNLSPNTTGRIVTKQKVDVIETEYAITGDGSAELVQSNNLIAFLVNGDSTGFTVPTVRV